MSCLCRTLLAFVAVSCTLSCIHAHGQAPQRLDRIKDLMCVFLLSGMQKEDLDVNMLTKLQRHNVNISDMSNRELIQECTRIKRIENMKNNSFETTTIITTTAKDVSIRVEEIDMLFNKTHDKNAINDTKESTNNKAIIDYIDGQPDMQSVLNFWQNMKVKRSNISLHLHKKAVHFTDASQTKSEQKNKRNVNNNTNGKETENFQKLITKYILRDINNNTLKQQTSTVKANIEVENDLKDSYFQQIFHDYNNRYLLENNVSGGNIYFNSPLRMFDQYMDMRRTQESTPTVMITTEILKNDTNINEMFNFLNEYKTYYTDFVKNKNKESGNSEQEINLKINIVTDKPLTNNLNNNIPQNFIKEIAVSVKDMVLKELRKEMKSATRTVEPVTTTVDTITTNDVTAKSTPKANLNIEEVILNKFLDLVQEIKSLKQNTIIMSNKKVPNIKMERIELNENAQIQKTMGEQSDMEPTKQIFSNIENKKPILYNFAPQIHKLRFFKKPTPIQHDPKPRQLITIQTNNMEIPPIGIPIDIPENPINENIIVTTAQYRIESNKNNLRNTKLHQNKAFDVYIPQEQYVAKSFTGPYYSNFNTKYKDMPINKKGHRVVEDNNNHMVVNRYKHFDDTVVAKAPVPRYHEKLENGDTIVDIAVMKQRNKGRIDCCDEKYAYSPQMVECCNNKIAARQQMSLSNVKKQSMYDTHYKNFVKSQKKVTDMLEKILATKNSRIQAPGVEVA